MHFIRRPKSYSTSQRKTEDQVSRVGCAVGGGVQIRSLPSGLSRLPFYFLSWYEEPFTVLASLRVNLFVDDFNFGRITVGHIAADYVGLSRHLPR